MVAPSIGLILSYFGIPFLVLMIIGIIHSVNEEVKKAATYYRKYVRRQV